MNLMLVGSAMDALLLDPADPRAVHIRKVLGMKPGDRFDVGAENGPRGKALIESDDAQGMRLGMSWGGMPGPSLPVELLVGMSRPQTMRKILREAPALGVAVLHVAACGRSEAGYAESSLWKSGECDGILRLGTEQAFTTRVPVLKLHGSLSEALDDAARRCGEVLAMDNYEASLPLQDWRPMPGAGGSRTLVCIGPERGWEAAERDLFRSRGHSMAHLGPRVLRTETATIVSLALVAAARGLWHTMTD